MNLSRYFSCFWSQNKIHYYTKKIHIDTLGEIQDALKDKMKYSRRGIIDLDFEKDIVRKTLFFEYIKNGVLEFLPPNYITLFIKVLNDQMYPEHHNDIQELYDFISKIKTDYEFDVKELRKKIKIYKIIG